MSSPSRTSLFIENFLESLPALYIALSRSAIIARHFGDDKQKKAIQAGSASLYLCTTVATLRCCLRKTSRRIKGGTRSVSSLRLRPSGLELRVGRRKAQTARTLRANTLCTHPASGSGQRPQEQSQSR